jgi:hypothetical protein
MSEQNTHADMVIQIVSDRQINPLVGRNHGRSVNLRVVDDLQLISGANAACDCELKQ